MILLLFCYIELLQAEKSGILHIPKIYSIAMYT